jgi:uncharacterized protein YciI
VTVRFDQHTLVLLVRPPDAPEFTDEEALALQDAHLAHQAGLAERGLVVTAGPLTGQDDERLRGICVLSVDAEEARRLYEQDPAVRAGRMAVQVMTWLVPAGGATFTPVTMPRSTAEAVED